MGLTLIYGRAGTGKSTYILNEIKERLDNCDKVYIITPEQFSFHTELKLLESLDTSSTLKAEVLTFQRMAYRVIEEVGGGINTTLSLCGRFMLLHNIVSKKAKDLKFLNSKDGNIELISNTITELKKHGITLEELKIAIEQTKNLQMKTKLEDIYLTYNEYENSINSKYIDEDDILKILCEKIEESNLFKNSLIYIDEFAGFTKQEYEIIGELLMLSKEVTVTICADNLELLENPEKDIFYENKKTATKLIELAKQKRVTIGKEIELNNLYRFKKEELKHIEKNMFSYPYKIYDNNEKQEEVIDIFVAQNIYSEVEHIANEIRKLVEQGYRYKEISVVTKNIENYSSIILAVFKSYNIPIYIDEKKDLASNILIKFVLSLLEIFAKNWSYESMFSYIKTGMLKVEKTDIDLLENYVIRWGIRGNTWLKEDWTFEKEGESFDLDRINKTRKEIVEPLLKFKERLSGTKTVYEITKSLYEFLIENEIPKKIEEKIKVLQEIGEIQTANEYVTVWDILLEVFDEMVLVLKEEKISFEKYTDTLKLGFRNRELGTIPATNDQVIVGDIDRSKSHKIRACFIIRIK